MLENVVVDERGRLDLDDDSKTENTRAAYELERISNALPTKLAGHPTNVVFLTADAFAILPPIARLTDAQARYYFLSGFTARARRHRDRRHRAGSRRSRRASAGRSCRSGRRSTRGSSARSSPSTSPTSGS